MFLPAPRIGEEHAHRVQVRHAEPIEGDVGVARDEMEVIDRSRLAPIPPDVARRAAALGVRVAPRVRLRHERRVNLEPEEVSTSVSSLEEVRVRARGALQETPLGAPDVAQSRKGRVGEDG